MQPTPRTRQNRSEPEETAADRDRHRSTELPGNHADQKRRPHKQVEHDERIEKENCVAQINSQVPPESARRNEIQKRKDAERNSRTNAATTEGGNHIVPANQVIIGFDQPIGASRRHPPLGLVRGVAKIVNTCFH